MTTREKVHWRTNVYSSGTGRRNTAPALADTFEKVSFGSERRVWLQELRERQILPRASSRHLAFANWA